MSLPPCRNRFSASHCMMAIRLVWLPSIVIFSGLPCWASPLRIKRLPAFTQTTIHSACSIVASNGSPRFASPKFLQLIHQEDREDHGAVQIAPPSTALPVSPRSDKYRLSSPQVPPPIPLLATRQGRCLLPLVRLRRRNDGLKRQPPRARATNHKQLGNTVSSILSSMRCLPVQCVSGESKLTAAYQRALVDQILQIAGGGSA